MITSEQVRAARALLRWEQRDLAGASGVSLPSIKRLEAERGPLAAQVRTVDAIQGAFFRGGAEFTNDGGLPGVRLRKVPPVDATDAEILALNTKGLSLRKISAALKAKGVDMSHERVRHALARLQRGE